jgi:hypothetical protein
MKFAFWNHYFSFTTVASVSAAASIERLSSLYRSKGIQRVAIDSEKNTIVVEKGSIWCSIFVIGPETWCRHIVTVKATDVPGAATELEFGINLKLVGWTLGKNSLIEECRAVSAALR